MKKPLRTFLALLSLGAPPLAVADPLAPWSEGVTIKKVAPDEPRHSIHSYFNVCPESPDGKHVLYFTSGTREGELGDLRILERATGKETIIAEDIATEDAHRVACQQWANDGRTIVYHDNDGGTWRVIAVDLATLEKKVLVEDRQLGFGSATHPWVPVYGCHWNPGPHRDLEMIHVETGKIRKPVTVGRVLDTYGDWVREQFGTEDVAIFFPVLSPDGNRVFFKIARPSGGDDFKSKQASYREGKVVFNLKEGEFIRLSKRWGHPSWDPQSKNIFEKGNFIEVLETGQTIRYARSAPSNHPTLAPDGKIFVTDADVSKRDFGKPGEWAIVMGDTSADRFVVVHQFDHTGGARSWRPVHPHPAFSADGSRVYYNVNGGEWSRLYVAERAPQGAATK